MRLLLIRHAVAVPRGTPGIPDDDRPLTARGRRRFRKAAGGLARISRRPDALLTSPLPRAAETARLCGRAWGRLEPVDLPALRPGRNGEIRAALAAYPQDALLALVGHEPDLSAFLATLLGTPRAEGLAFRKGGVARVDLPDGPAGPARLAYVLTPKLLRGLR
jgi:phosphohistidine phosphatase